ncbi:hypothetical protein ACQEVY_00365 [Streptomyces sp. CA-288835]|uniref:hypothetical protein n=1 Tax=Streptomyces sp. CA-288835 TaxID=3240069 RepID=UPI003D8C5C19
MLLDVLAKAEPQLTQLGLGPWARVFRDPRARSAAAIVAARTEQPFQDLEAEHIPAFLEHDWYQRHLARFCGHAPKFLRRAAAVQLVQWAMGGSRSDAAEFLGINPNQVRFKVASEPRFWAQAGCDPTQLDAALRELASELGAHPRLFVDYRRRREALRGWALDRTIWITLINTMQPLPRSIRPDFDDRKRQEASVFVWTQVTQGEHLFAPRTIAARQP